LINNNKGTMKLKDISSNLNKNGFNNENTIRWRLGELVKEGKLSRVGRAVYKTPQQTNNPTKLNNTNILNNNKEIYIDNNVCLLDSTTHIRPIGDEPSEEHCSDSNDLNEEDNCLNVCLLDHIPQLPGSTECDQHQDQNSEPDEEELDPDTQEDVSNLLTPDICRKDCIQYDPVKPSDTNGNKELKEFCYASVSGSKIIAGNVCNNYKNKTEKDALELEGCLNF
jgi:hypothetical protein